MEVKHVLRPVCLSLALLAVLSCREQEVRIPVPEGTLYLEPLAENAIRVRIVPEGAVPLDELIYTEQVRAPRCWVERKNGQVTLRTDRMSVVYAEATRSLTFLDAEGNVLLEEIPGGRAVEPTEVQGETAFSVREAFRSPEGEHLFGTGQFQDGYLDIRGLPRRLVQLNTQISVPMILSNRGYGLMWHNYGLTDFNPAGEPVELVRQADGRYTGEVVLDRDGEYGFLLTAGERMATRHSLTVDGQVLVERDNVWLPASTSVRTLLPAGTHRVEIQVDGDVQPTLAWRAVTEETVFSSPVAQALDYTVFAGSADEVMHSFRTLSGHVPPMPDWMFRYIHCRERYDTQEQLLTASRRFQEEGIPVGTLVQDWLWWGKHGWNAMRFDEDKYPDPAAMVREVHERDQHLMLSVWSKIDRNSDAGKAMQEGGGYIGGSDWVDFFRPEAAALYWKFFSGNLVPLGIDAWWQDATEPENDDLQGRRVGPGQAPGEFYRNVYPLKVIGTVYEGLRRDAPDRAPVLLTRSGFSGMQRYGAITWSGDVKGDWDAFRRQIVGGLGQMAAGLPWWTCDAGGFFRPAGQYTDPAYQELMVRWIQASVWFPFMRVHGYMSRTEPWEYPEETERLFLQSIRQRESLLPYILDCAKRVSEADYTLMRPLVFDFPEDGEALRQEGEFMFGPDYLVCPVTKPQVNSWRVYLPWNPGGWEEIRTGEMLMGGRYLDVPVDLEAIPVFRRLPTPAWRDESLPVAERVEDLLGQLALEEKIGLMRATSPAIPRLGIDKYYHGNEALHGIVRPGRFTVFPQAIGLASMWDPELLEAVSSVVSDEARARWNELGRGALQRAQFSDLLTFWSPTVNMARDPRWGRTPETYGEDPFLSGEMGAAFVRGLQGKDPRYLKAVSTPKHFSANNEEHNRFECNAVISEKQMREYYLPAFESCIRRGRAASIMSAYNAINGVPCTGNPWLLTKVLREDWGFDGYVVSDCGAVGNILEDHHYVNRPEEAAQVALQAGLDLECGDNIYIGPLRQALDEGLVQEADIDRAARRILTARMRLGLFDNPAHNPYNALSPAIVGSEPHRKLALQAAREAIVLLRNEGHALPLDKGNLRSLAVVGINAASCEFGDYSGEPVTEPVSVLEGIRNLAGPDVRIEYVPWAAGVEPAVEKALQCDAVVAVMGINKSIEREGKDRKDISLPADQLAFLQAVYRANPKLALVVVAGSPLALLWENLHIPAIVNAWYPGQEGGTAVAEVLFGEYNPAGRLPLTFYQRLEDLPAFDDYDITKRTYKYFDGEVLYPFGYGLSYTTFDYSDLQVRDRGDRVEVTFRLRNSGSRDGDEVAQVYVRIPGYEGKAPIKELRGFQRVFLKAGETREVTVDLRREDLRYWSESSGSFVVPKGLPTVLVGASSADIRLVRGDV